jgi:cyclophilin family peptidyl-prolyl cis-trans isomerase
MSVLLETSKGDVVIDLLVEECPVTCKNFLKLCKWVPSPLGRGMPALGSAINAATLCDQRRFNCCLRLVPAAPVVLGPGQLQPDGARAARLCPAQSSQLDCALPPLRSPRIKYYNNSLFHNVQSNFIAQTGAPAGDTSGGSSVYG